MTHLSLNKIKEKAESLCDKIGANLDSYVTFGTSRDFGYPHIEVDSYGYHFVVVERGQELERRITDDIDELIYLILDVVTSSMAWDYEVENRIEDQDSRKLAFTKQLELMNKISNSYAEKLQRHIDGILKVAPYTTPPDFI